MSLDILTPKGHQTVLQEIDMLSILKDAKPDTDFIHTPIKNPAKVDGFTIRNQTITSVFESKCRQMTQDQLIQEYDNTWLVTYEKIAQGAHIASILSIPFVGFLYLVPEQTVLIIKIADEKGNFIPDISLARTETQETINGGKITRTNAYISMRNSTRICK
jgi:hypothetical protein